MRITTLLFVLCSTFSFAQTRFNVEFTDSTIEKKDAMSGIENYIPDTYERRFDKNSISFSTPIDYDLSEMYTVVAMCNIPNAVITKEKTPGFSIEKAGGTNCESAMQLCNGASVPGNSSGAGIQELNNANSGCLGTEHQSSWYYVNVLTGGNLVLRINPDNNHDDYDFAIWGPFTAANAGANCPPTSGPVRCSYSHVTGNTGLEYGAGSNSENANGSQWVNALPVSANQVYILLVDNYSASNDGYNIDFSFTGNLSTAVLGCIPVVLPVEISSFKGGKANSEDIIQWTTESETNNDYFIVESTIDPNADNWKVIANVNGAGTTTNQMNYSWEDFTYTKNEINYYRLTQVDFDGSKRVYNKLVAIDNRIGDKTIVKTVNLLGQEIDSATPGLVIYCYDDGTTEKRYN